MLPDSYHHQPSNTQISNNRIVIKLTQGGINSKYVIVTGHESFFPREAFGESSRDLGEGSMLKFEVAGTNYKFESDIDSTKKFIRDRSWLSDLIRVYKLKAGDLIIIEKINENSYKIHSSNQE